jgi:selenocysteine lyase/cysteine desulfurase
VAAEGLRSLVEDGTVIVNTMLEHNSDELPWRYLPGVSLAHLSVDQEGFVDLVELENLLRAYNHHHQHGHKRIRLVCVCGASNVMGTYNDLPAISRLAHRYGAKLLVDAAQLAAHRPVRMAEDGIDLLAFSAHKMYAPFGSGGLIATKGTLSFSPQQGRTITASGEENVAGIAALGKAMDLLARIGMDTVMQEEREMTRYALARLSGIPGLALHGVTDPRVPRFAGKGGVLVFELQRVPHNLLARLLAEQGGIGVRSGCFCVNMYVKQLLGIGAIKNLVGRAGLALMPRTIATMLAGLVRVSFGLTNQPAEIDRLAETLLKISQEKLGLANRLLAKHHFGTPFMPHTPITQEITLLATRKLTHIFAPSGMTQ